jgi:hypothetical protein
MNSPSPSTITPLRYREMPSMMPIEPNPPIRPTPTAREPHAKRHQTVENRLVSFNCETIACMFKYIVSTLRGLAVKRMSLVCVQRGQSPEGVDVNWMGCYETLTYLVRDILKALRYPPRGALRRKYHVDGEMVFDVHDN